MENLEFTGSDLIVCHSIGKIQVIHHIGELQMVIEETWPADFGVVRTRAVGVTQFPQSHVT